MALLKYIKDELNDDTEEEEQDQPFIFPLKMFFKIYLHLPQDSNWSIESYKNIMEFSSLDEIIEFFQVVPSNLLKKGMVFVMKQNILPMWEHPENINGGSFCYKVPKSVVSTTFKHLVYAFVGNGISDNEDFINDITGITVSPKVGDFSILKIWTKSLRFQDPTIVKKIENLAHSKCIFKKHSS
jgi:Eukaryotic initiation factor 4E